VDDIGSTSMNWKPPYDIIWWNTKYSHNLIMPWKIIDHGSCKV
jgi:hypothetical protein